MVEIVIVSIICVSILLALMIFSAPDFIKARKDAQIEIMKQSRIADDRVHDRWKEMLTLEAQLNKPELPVSEEVQLARLELSTVEANARLREAEAASEKVSGLKPLTTNHLNGI